MTCFCLILLHLYFLNLFFLFVSFVFFEYAICLWGKKGFKLLFDLRRFKWFYLIICVLLVYLLKTLKREVDSWAERKVLNIFLCFTKCERTNRTCLILNNTSIAVDRYFKTPLQSYQRSSIPSKETCFMGLLVWITDQQF